MSQIKQTILNKKILNKYYAFYQNKILRSTINQKDSNNLHNLHIYKMVLKFYCVF